MSKIVISGFYGFHNIGDEAILKALTQELMDLDKSIEITVLSHNPEETMAKFKVNAVNRRDVLKVFNAIRKADILLSGGGSLLQDDTSARSIHYYLAILRMGLFLRKKVFLISNGIGPINRPSNRKHVAKVLNRVNHSTVRDNNSRELLIEIGVNPEKVTVSADLVVGMPMESLDKGEDILNKLGIADHSRKNLAIAIRQKDFREQDRRDALVQLANELAREYNVVFIPFYYKNDTKIYNDIHMDTDEHVYFITDKYNSDEFMSLLQNMHILVGSRLHSLIFSLVAEVPFVGISYDPKIENFMDMIDMAPVCSMKNFNNESIKTGIMEIERDYDQAIVKVLAAKQKLKECLAHNDEMLKKVL